MTPVLAWAMGWTLLLWLSVPFLRPVSEWLRGGGMLVLSLNAAVTVLLATAAWKSRPGLRGLSPKRWAALAGLVGVYLFLFFRAVVAPEERFHFLVMPPLTLAWIRAMGNLRGAAIAALAAAVEESLQAITPGRVFDLRDLAINAGAVVLTALSVCIAFPPLPSKMGEGRGEGGPHPPPSPGVAGRRSSKTHDAH